MYLTTFLFSVGAAIVIALALFGLYMLIVVLDNL